MLWTAKITKWFNPVKDDNKKRLENLICETIILTIAFIIAFPLVVLVIAWIANLFK